MSSAAIRWCELGLRSYTLKNRLALDLLHAWPCAVSAEKELPSIPSIFTSVGWQLREAGERVWEAIRDGVPSWWLPCFIWHVSNSYASYTTVFRRAREGTRPIEVSAVREAQSLSLTFS